VLCLRFKRKGLKIRSYLCRLPSAVNVMLNLSIDHEFRHNIIKVVCGSTRLSPRGSTSTTVIAKFLMLILFWSSKLSVFLELRMLAFSMEVTDWHSRPQSPRSFWPGARFSKAPKTFRARKAIFSSFVYNNGEVHTPENSCMKGTSLNL